MNKQICVFLLCNIFVAISVQAGEGGEISRSRGLPQRDFYTKGNPTEEETAILRVKREKDAKVAAAQKEAAKVEAARKEAVERHQQRAVDAAGRIERDEPTRTSQDKPDYEVVKSMNERFPTGVKLVKPVPVKSVKSVSDQLIDASNTFSKAEGNKKESFAKELLGFPKDENVTEDRIVAASFAKIKELRDNSSDFGVVELVHQRILQARDLLIDSLKKQKELDLSIADFVKTNKSVEDNSPLSNFRKSIRKLINRVVSFFSRNENPKEFSTVLSSVFDSNKDELSAKTKIVEEKFQEVAKTEPNIAKKMQVEIKNFIIQRLKNPKISAEEKENITKSGTRLLNSLEQKKEELSEVDTGW